MLLTRWFAAPHRAMRDLDLLGFVDPGAEAMFMTFRETLSTRESPGGGPGTPIELWNFRMLRHGAGSPHSSSIQEGCPRSRNESHQIIIVASELDASTERIVSYLNARDIAINVVFFQVFEHEGQQLLSRAWLIDLGETQANVAVSTRSKGEKEPWNGEYYVSFGGDCTWDDARTYGFVSAGGGRWYSQTLRMLSPGDRVWVKIPKAGYVGVGRVTEAARSVAEFTVSTPSGEMPCLDVLSSQARLAISAADVDKAEYFVQVQWLDTVPETKAINEVGMFGNQNTVCQPLTPKWRHTVERLKTHFPKWNQPAG